MTHGSDLEAVDEPRPAAWPAPAIVLAVLFAALHGWFVYQAIGNLVNVPAAYAAVGLSDSTPWVLLAAGLAFPLVSFIVAASLATRRALANRVLLFTASLGASSATALSMYVLSAWLVTVG